jgi:hypothetical protein
VDRQSVATRAAQWIAGKAGNSQVWFYHFCQWLSQTPLSIWLREAPYPFPVFLIAHILTIAVFGGMVVMGNLRVLGKAMREVPVSEVIGQFRAWKWFAFAFLLVSGLFVAMSDPMEYYDNVMFWISMGILVLAGVNAAIFRYGIYRSVASWDTAVVAPLSARRWARVSIFLWIALILSGRATAFF